MNKNKFSVFAVSADWFNKSQIDYKNFESIDSTNNEAKKMIAQSPAEPTGFLALAQTAGRGRGTNIWLNPLPHDGLLLTWSFLLQQSPQPITSPLVGLHIYRAFQSIWPEGLFRIKAPNDIYLDNKKFCGLLIEVVQSRDEYRLLVGIGANVFSHPIEITTATNLAHHLDVNEVKWHRFLQKLLIELQKALLDCTQPELSVAKRHEMLLALNSGLPQSEHYSSISANCDLVRNDTTISWRDL